MRVLLRKSVLIPGLVTLACLILWQATGGDYYTKFQVVEEVPKEIDPNDPLAQAGFYEEDATEIVTRDVFRFGLLPTPQGIFDKHVVSVVSIVIPIWMVSLLAFWWDRRHSRNAES